MKTVLSVLALVLGLMPVLAQAQAAPATPNVAAVDFRVVIPRFVKITANSYPPVTNATNVQEVELETSVAGACVQLVNLRPDVEWSAEITSPGWIGTRNQQGYTFCNLEKGKYTLSLIHRFNWSGLDWPLRTTVSAAP